jgi:hypothetical protein
MRINQNGYWFPQSIQQPNYREVKNLKLKNQKLGNVKYKLNI